MELPSAEKRKTVYEPNLKGMRDQKYGLHMQYSNIY